ATADAPSMPMRHIRARSLRRDRTNRKPTPGAYAVYVRLHGDGRLAAYTPGYGWSCIRWGWSRHLQSRPGGAYGVRGKRRRSERTAWRTKHDRRRITVINTHAAGSIFIHINRDKESSMSASVITFPQTDMLPSTPIVTGVNCRAAVAADRTGRNEKEI